MGTREWDISKSEFQNTDEPSEPFKESHDVVIREHVTSVGNLFYLNPFVMMRLESNTFKLESREYPVNFGNPFDQVYLCKISIPEGYTVDELPQSKVIMLPGQGAQYTYSITQMGNIVSIMSSLKINKSIFIQDEYPFLRELYSQVVAKQAEQIVIRKN